MENMGKHDNIDLCSKILIKIVSVIRAKDSVSNIGQLLGGVKLLTHVLLILQSVLTCLKSYT